MVSAESKASLEQIPKTQLSEYHMSTAWLSAEDEYRAHWENLGHDLPLSFSSVSCSLHSFLSRQAKEFLSSTLYKELQATKEY